MLDYEYEWAAHDSAGQQMAQGCGLPRAKPIMYSEDSTGEVMFQAGNTFYLWNQLSGGVRKILCEDLSRIIEIMTKRGLRGLRLKTGGTVAECGSLDVEKRTFIQPNLLHLL